MNSRTRVLWATTALVSGMLLAGAASAQSTGTDTAELGTIVVTGQRGQRTIEGAIAAENVGKSRSTVTQEFIQTQAAGQTINEVLNLVPGMNFTNNDPYGSSGGNIRLHGFDSNRIAQTFDGMPLNDSGNYALYTNQQLDSELIDRATVNTGTTDADSPTASGSGGTINISSLTPSQDFGGWLQGSLGDFSYERVSAFVNTGAVGPWGTRAWFAYSDQSYDKFKGLGSLNKIQYNAKFYQPIRDNGDFLSLAFHWNRNRNNNYNGPNLYANADGSLRSDVDTSPWGWNVDFPIRDYVVPTFRNGVADYDTNGTGYWGLQINPSNTGNIRGQSRFTLREGLRLTIDPSFQYVLANGGSQQTVMAESSVAQSLTGNSPDNTWRQLVGSFGAGGVDLNGDGDTLDRVRVMSPSNTHTQRYGLNSSLLWDINADHSLRLAYSLDWARHRQTGAFGRIDFSDPAAPRFVQPFGGWSEEGNQILNRDGAFLRSRDRLSYAILNQVALEYRGRFFEDRLRLNLGVRAPFFKREMNQNCFSQRGSSSVLCTTQTPTISANSTANATYYNFAGYTVSRTNLALVDYVAPYSRTKEFDDILPNVNATWRFNDEHSVYASYAESMTLPRTDNLYTVQYDAGGDLVSPIINPEKTETYDVGYRFQTATLLVQANVWFTKFKDRINSAYDPDLNISTDRNIGDVEMKGFDAAIGWSPVEALSFYASASYNDSEVMNDYRSSATTVIPVGGKTLVETPEWTYVLSARYNRGPLSAGIQAKYVGERYMTDVNDLQVPSYTTINADAKFDLEDFGLEGTYLQINAINLLDEEYYGSLGGTGVNALPVTGISGVSTLYASRGAPRTLQATIRYAF